MNTMWLDEPPMYELYEDNNNYKNSNQNELVIPDIKCWRRTEFVDFQKIYQLTRMKTYDMFGDLDPAEVSEKSCLSLVQINAIDEVVANISLCNYPNIPSIPCDGWIEWISKHYGIHGITERNTLFIHMLLWDVRYNEKFYKRLLDAVFLSVIHTTHVIFIMPPWVTPVGFVEEHMARIVPNGVTDSYRIQALYISLRYMHCPRLKIRRVVEEDNDDIIPILDRESKRFKELYGEFYISEMMRYPDGIRQLVVAESDGLATGVLCLNKIVDIQSLNEHFELAPYHGLQKHYLGDEIHHENETYVTSDILFPAEELEKNDHLVNPALSKISAFHLKRNIYEDVSDRDGIEIEFSCSDNGEICNRVYSEAPCSSCKKTWRNIVERSSDFDAETDVSRKSTASLSSVEKMKETSKTISKPGVKISPEDHPEFHYDSINKLMKTKSLSTAQDSEKVPAFTFDVMSSDTVSTSKITSSQSTVRMSETFAPNLKTVSISKVRMNVNSRDYDDDSDEEEEEEHDLFGEEEEEQEFSLTDVAVEISPRKIVHKNIKLPIYRGKVNAFTLELFSMREDIDEKLSHDYLEAVFECFPDEDYCVVLIPPLFPTFPLLQSFVRVPLRFNKDYPLVMYLAHRAAVIGELKTKEASYSDITMVAELLSDVPKRNQVLNDFEFVFESGSPYSAYTFLCQGTIVGFAILCVEKEFEFIRSHYRIDDFISFGNSPAESHARIIHLMIMPIFANLHRYFFQELIHLSNKYALYYRLYHNDASAMTRAEPLVTFLGEMIPVLPRRKLKYCLSNYLENKPADFVIQNTKDNFALYMMVPRIASTPKIDVNVRVVVVGASDCGLSVLETLVFGPNAASISLTNITLISPNGIPFENRPDDIEEDQLPFGGHYSRDYRHLVGTRAWINVVHGTLTAINRKDKFVTVSSMGIISYDYLILTCGRQYQRPKFVEELNAEKKGDFRDYPNPENCLTINDERDAANCLRFCRKIFAENPSCSVIFYGQNIDAYSSLAMLINSGLSPRNITLVEPAVNICEHENKTFFGNDEVEEAVIKVTKESGVNFISGYDLVDWILEQDNEDFFIKSLILEEKGNRRNLDCDIFFNFKEKTVNMNTFFAICRSGLVFDGSLVIDPEFQTNDTCIFAAGTITKYSRRFYADDYPHKYHNRCEIGERLGQKLRNIIHPENSGELDNSPAQISKLDMIFPVFKRPIVTSCRLPGGYYYLNVEKPGKLIPEDNNDVSLITGYPASSIGYFRIHFNQFDAVETITCLSQKDFEVENYISLYGKHETLLNDLKIRFQNSMVPDLYAYFREPWAVALFLDRFECLRVENRATLLSPTVVCGDTLVHDCTKALIKSKWHSKMLQSVSPRLSPRGTEPRIIRLTTDQETVLQEQFNRCPRAPHTADIVLLAAETGLSEADVQGWYAIRLAQWRKEQGLGGNLHFSN